MKTLHEVAEEICPYRLEDYDPAIDDILDECLHDSWIVGFIAGAQWREENPVAAGSVSDSIELCGLLWDTENLAIGGYEKDGHHYYTWQEAMEAAKSVGKRLRPGRNGRHYAISARLGTTSARAVGSGATTTRTTRDHYSCLLRAGAASIIATS